MRITKSCQNVPTYLESALLALAITAAAISIFKRLPEEDAVLLGAAFTQLGDTLATLAAAQARLEPTEQEQKDDAGEPSGR